MTLSEYMALLRRSWVLITATLVVGLGLGVAASVLTTPVYSATAQLFVSVQNVEGEGVGTAYTGGLFVQQRVLSYTNVIDSPDVLEPVIEDLDLVSTPTALAGQVSADSPKNTVLIDVTATDTDPAMAAAIANATAKSFGKQIQALETTTAGSVPVKASIVRPATVPASPDSPNTKLNLALGAFLGLGLGVSIALLRHTLDTTVKTRDNVVEATGGALLGIINFDPDAKIHPLVALDQSSRRSEAFRGIRTNLRYLDADIPKVVVITSSVPNEGKTTTASNLAITLAQAGSRVLLIEADLRKPRVADYLGVDGGVGLTDALVGLRTATDVIVSWKRGLLDVLPSGPIPPNPSELLGSPQMTALLEGFASTYDVVILDAPPLLPVTDAAVLANLSDGAILVTRHGRTRRDQLAQSAEALHQVNARILGTIINFVPAPKKTGYGYGYAYGYGYRDEYGDASPARGRLSTGDVVPTPDVAGPAPADPGPSTASGPSASGTAPRERTTPRA